MRRLLVFCALLTPGAWAQACPNAGVGFQTVMLGASRVAVWYPSSAPEAHYAYFDRLAGSVALNGAPAACSGLPLVVFSHGYGGCGTQSVFITEELARRGFVVAAPDHADATCSAAGTGSGEPTVSQAPFTQPETWSDQSFANRRADVVSVINGMLASAVFGRLIDPHRIAGMGHSLGGYTMLGMAGGWQSWFDPRIRAVVLLSPYSQPFLAKSTLGGVRVPVQYQGGTLDLGVTPWVERTEGAYDQTPPTKFFLNLRLAGHFVWTNSTCTSAGTVAECLRTSSNAALINTHTQAFLDHYVRGLDAPLLWERGAGLAEYRRESALRVVNAAGFQEGRAAPSSIATLYSEGFAELPAGGIQAPDPLRLPAELGGVEVRLIDSAGAQRTAPLYFVSPVQVNFVMPAGMAAGMARVEVRSAGTAWGRGVVTVAEAAPGLFFAAVRGSNLAVGHAVYVRTDGPAWEPLVAAGGANAVDVRAGEVYLVLYGTGMRAGAASARAAIGGVSVAVLYVAAQSEFAGLDQVGLGPLPSALAGRGAVPVAVEIAGQAANAVEVAIR
jgi:uncharacterized protein (TIGR03437 family)